ncbi:hypothetical protein HY968_00205 [Candidatus Kaiserbacteria bacterium]|nr:hypothetical protein [Candidatus Kaiserbacteria bacterium]
METISKISNLNLEKGSMEWTAFDAVRDDKVSIFGTPRFPATERKLRVRGEVEYRPLVLAHR